MSKLLVVASMKANTRLINFLLSKKTLWLRLACDLDLGVVFEHLFVANVPGASLQRIKNVGGTRGYFIRFQYSSYCIRFRASPPLVQHQGGPVMRRVARDAPDVITVRGVDAAVRLPAVMRCSGSDIMSMGEAWGKRRASSRCRTLTEAAR
jgi:hypothetical protein